MESGKESGKWRAASSKKMLTTVALPTPKGAGGGWPKPALGHSKGNTHTQTAHIERSREREKERTTYASQLKCRKNYWPPTHTHTRISSLALRW